MDTLTRMRAYIDVVDSEGFSAAARKNGRSKALLSKYVRELEDELGALLINRTTRQFSLTEAGHTYFRRANEIVRDIDSLADSVRDSAGDARGRIRLTAPRSFADAEIGRSLVDFLHAFPDIALDISLDDRFVDLVEEGFDLAIRITRMEDSTLIARKIASFGLVACASPAFIARHGEPMHPSTLATLPCIVDTNSRTRNAWRFEEGGNPISVSVAGPLEANSPLTTIRAAEAGLGVAFIPDFNARDALAAGRLVPILADFIPADRGIYAIYPHRRYLPARVRVFVDFLAKWFRDYQSGPAA
ncbi:MAG: LysR family transcriptional regulator [Phyllobacteriaceae bacterium]|nr:LysR family transcriptional regulator [Phyllobacteriaceae bacterium]